MKAPIAVLSFRLELGPNTLFYRRLFMVLNQAQTGIENKWTNYRTMGPMVHIQKKTIIIPMRGLYSSGHLIQPFLVPTTLISWSFTLTHILTTRRRWRWPMIKFPNKLGNSLNLFNQEWTKSLTKSVERYLCDIKSFASFNWVTFISPENWYWSLEKNTAAVIIQRSKHFECVHDRIQGNQRIYEITKLEEAQGKMICQWAS